MIFDLYAALGVTEGEVFKINGFEYMIEDGLMHTRSDDEWIVVSYPVGLLHGAEIEKVGGKVE